MMMGQGQVRGGDGGGTCWEDTGPALFNPSICYCCQKATPITSWVMIASSGDAQARLLTEADMPKTHEVCEEAKA